MGNNSVQRLFDEEGNEKFGSGESESISDDIFEEVDLDLAEKAPVSENREKYHPKSKKDIRKARKRKRRLAREKKRERHPGLYNMLDWVKVIVIAVVIALFLNYFVIINSRVPSGSMETTIMTGSRMIGLRFSYIFSDPERGDIIIFKYPDDESVNYVKRVIGLPGETVEIKDGFVYIDGEILTEDYLDVTTEGDFGPYTVPEGCYFVLGDNRNNSHDSRYWDNTYVPEENIIGKAVFCYWPISNIGVLK